MMVLMDPVKKIWCMKLTPSSFNSKVNSSKMFSLIAVRKSWSIQMLYLTVCLLKPMNWRYKWPTESADNAEINGM